ncbi:MAG: helix-turn-helix domain-containing protein [candidate division WOR-3 bacterium]
MVEEELTILTAKEAAEYLRVSLYTLRRMENEGSLIPFRTPGGPRRYSLQMLTEYLEQSRLSSRRRTQAAGPRSVEAGQPESPFE